MWYIVDFAAFYRLRIFRVYVRTLFIIVLHDKEGERQEVMATTMTRPCQYVVVVVGIDVCWDMWWLVWLSRPLNSLIVYTMYIYSYAVLSPSCPTETHQTRSSVSYLLGGIKKGPLLYYMAKVRRRH